MFMGKRSETYIKNVAKDTIKILKKRKVKTRFGEKIYLDKDIEKSIDESIMAPINSIISKEAVFEEAGKKEFTVNITLGDIMESVYMLSTVEPSVKRTIIVPLKKNDSLQFDFTNPYLIGDILRDSTFSAVYKEVCEKWRKMNTDQCNTETNVLYFPDIVFFKNDSGPLFTTPYKANVLVLSIPSRRMLATAFDNDSEKICSSIIADIMDASISCGAKDIIIEPLGYGLLNKEDRIASNLWFEILDSNKVKMNLNSAYLSIPNKLQYVLFASKNIMKKATETISTIASEDIVGPVIESITEEPISDDDLVI